MLHEFKYFSKEDPDLFRSIVAMPWLADGVSGEETIALTHLMFIYRAEKNAEKNRIGESSMAERKAALQWFSDGVTNDEAGAFPPFIGFTNSNRN